MANELNPQQILHALAVEWAVEEMELPDDLDKRLDDLAYEAAVLAKQFWSEEAGRLLNTTRLRYQQSLEIYEDFSGGGVVIGMNPKAKLSIAQEEGRPSYNLRATHLTGGAVRRVIPYPGASKDMRTMTADQADSKWQHPGFTALNLAEATENQLDRVIVPRLLNKLFDSL